MKNARTGNDLLCDECRVPLSVDRLTARYEGLHDEQSAKIEAAHRASDGIEEDDNPPCWCGVENPLYSDDLESMCGGSGFLSCECGGDFCVCHWHGGVDCDGCGDCREFDDDDDDDWSDDPATFECEP